MVASLCRPSRAAQAYAPGGGAIAPLPREAEERIRELEDGYVE